ncbi:MAG: family 16 glycoside hydrolase, partial [Planctomycetota bacterium]|nr:family 16 glycoside hydrolase [Planctomycetota bacterium]
MRVRPARRWSLAAILLATGCATSSETPEDQGFVPLFNGHDFAGWKVSETAEDHWSIRHHVLAFDGVKDDLWTEDPFEDFELLVSWRWVGPSQGPRERPLIDPDGSNRTDADGQVVTVEIEERDSGIYLRGNSKSQVNIWEWPIGSGEVYGYRTDGSMPAETR